MTSNLEVGNCRRPSTALISWLVLTTMLTVKLLLVAYTPALGERPMDAACATALKPSAPPKVSNTKNKALAFAVSAQCVFVTKRLNNPHWFLPWFCSIKCDVYGTLSSYRYSIL